MFPFLFQASSFLSPFSLFSGAISVPVTGKPSLRVELIHKAAVLSKTSSDLQDCLPPKHLTSRTLHRTEQN